MMAALYFDHCWYDEARAFRPTTAIVSPLTSTGTAHTDTGRTTTEFFIAAPRAYDHWREPVEMTYPMRRQWEFDNLRARIPFGRRRDPLLRSQRPAGFHPCAPLARSNC